MTEIERVCRAIDEALHGSRTDEEWQLRWRSHTDPEHVRLGGPWYIFVAARAAINVLTKIET